MFWFGVARFRAGARSENPVYLGGRKRIYKGMRPVVFPSEVRRSLRGFAEGGALANNPDVVTLAGKTA
jgi:hypothetical protein